MDKRIPFVKMHGLGNDFVIISKEHLAQLNAIEDFAAAISDRRLGVGADQFIIYQLLDKVVKMSIYNQDGTSAKACGNASRCLVKLMHDEHGLDSFVLEVFERKLKCKYVADEEYSVDMGEVAFDASWMPDEVDLLELATKYNLPPKDIICADVGNPHLIIFSKLSEADVEIIAKDIQNSKLFPDGVNINFANINGNVIRLKVYERGTGFTLACGSGACATFASAVRLGHIENNAFVEFALGRLAMQMHDNRVTMTGPAEYVFFGEYLYG